MAKGPTLRGDLAAALAAFGRVHKPFDVTQLPPEASRAAYAAGCGFWNSGAPEMPARDFRIGQVPARLYRPTGQERRAMLYLHGGGFVVGSVDSHDALMRRLAVAADAAVLGIDYRLAPEHAFPAARDDALAAWAWLRTNLPHAALTLAGDSAGACLALSTALALRGGTDAAAALVLFYGCFTPDDSSASHAEFGDGRFGLSTAAMRHYWKVYLAGSTEAEATPLHANLAGLPPTLLLAAGVDVLRDDSHAMAARLKAAGVPHTLRVWRGMNHGFMRLGSHVPATRAALRFTGCWLARTT
jgi:acetyl esterase